MSNKIVRVITYILAALPIGTFLILYNRIPELMPVHWGLGGTVRYDSKDTFFLISGIWLLMAVMFDILPKVDPRKKNYVKFELYYNSFRIFMAVFGDIISAIILIETFKPGTVAVSKVLPILIGIMMMFMGNIMPKIKSNFYIGVKTSWALSDNDVWNKTNRLGGKIMFCSGFLLMLGAFFLEEKVLFSLLMVLVVIILAAPMIMSYLWYRKKYSL